MPRLKRIKYERLYLPAKGIAGEFLNLIGVLTRPIRWDLITQQYDEMVKAAVALKPIFYSEGHSFLGRSSPGAAWRAIEVPLSPKCSAIYLA
jgi:Tn3 transposase DDE domain